jgi:dTDP-4-amino-4,6-dideoxygalactose transaminase
MTSAAGDELAIHGGSPVREAPFPGWPVYGEEERRQLGEVLDASAWGVGKRTGKIAEFEAAFAGFHGIPHAVATANCTQALEVLLQAHGLRAGDEVVLPSYTFIAPASAVCRVGGVPVFADIDDTLTVDPESVEALVGPRTRFLLPVHFTGHLADLHRLREIAGKHDLVLLEDAAQAHAALGPDGAPGSGTGGAAFSFQYSKNMTAGEGGILLLQDEAAAERCWEVVWHGRRKGGVWYEHFRATSNHRMTEWQAAVLLAQLGRLEEQTGIREQNGRYLDRRLAEEELPVRPARVDARVLRHPRHLYVLRLDRERFAGIPKAAVGEALRAEGIPVLDGYGFPVYRNPAFLEGRFGWDGCDVNRTQDYSTVRNPRAEEACADTLWLLHSVLLGTEADMEDVVRGLRKVCDRADELRP